MIYQELKRMRKAKPFTLKQLSSKVGYGTGNLSSYENGRLNAKDPTIARILTRGYDFTTEEAKQCIAHWRKEELEEVYELQLAQKPKGYNSKKSKNARALEVILISEGFDRKTINKIKGDIEEYKREM